MSRWLITLVLTVASATVWAQPARPAITAKAQDDLRSLEKRVVQLGGQRNTLAQQYEAQLQAIDRLKKQRASWRQQRELRTSLSDANDTATKLAAATNELAKGNTALANARRTLQVAIDAELAAGVTGPRATELAKLKSQLAPQTQKRVSRIVLPDMEIDPLADPEELDEHAAALRESEAQLSKQIAGLEQQAKDLDEVAKLRKQHERAGELSRRDDDQPQRTATQGGAVGGGRTSFEDSGAAPESAPGGAGGGAGNGTGTGTGTATGVGSFEADATIVLADVIDASTIETLTRASRTGDPAQRAQAAKKARDAVAGRLEQLKKKRAEIEALAKSRRLRR
jgi:hypothetical protein